MQGAHAEDPRVDKLPPQSRISHSAWGKKQRAKNMVKAQHKKARKNKKKVKKKSRKNTKPNQ